MNKKTLAEAVAQKLNCAVTEAEKYFNAFYAVIEEALASGESVCFSGIGTFKVKERAEKVGILPTSKQKIVIPAKKTVSFKAGKTLLEKLNAQ